MNARVRKLRQWYTPTEVANVLGLTRQHVCQQVREGRIPAIQTGKRAWHVTRDTVLSLAEERLGKQAARYLEASQRQPATTTPRRQDAAIPGRAGK